MTKLTEIEIIIVPWGDGEYLAEVTYPTVGAVRVDVWKAIAVAVTKAQKVLTSWTFQRSLGVDRAHT